MRTFKGWVCALAVMILAIGGEAAPQGGHTAKAGGSAIASRAQSTAASSAAKLPVRRVVLYKSGVGYFEHLGRVHGDQNVTINFTSGQLNDVLQSLTVLDLNGGRIAGVNYNSEAPLSQQLGTLRLPLDEKTDSAQFYGALRGARLVIKSGAKVITGRLLTMERKTRTSGNTTFQTDVATLVSDSGEVRSAEITPATSVQLAERDVAGEVGRYLSLLASQRQQDLRRMTISTTGTGDRQLYVSYISEVPIWKTTYRIVLPSRAGDKPLLQGWAIVDNTVGEDWDNVELSLMAGAPQSFIEQLSQPYYARRPVVPLPEYAQLTPQTHESAMQSGNGSLSGAVTDPSGAAISGAQVKLIGPDGQVVDTDTTDNQGRYELDDEPAGMYQLQVSMNGFQTWTMGGISLGGGNQLSKDVTLQVGAVAETVTVEAAPRSMAMTGRNYAVAPPPPAPAALGEARRQMEAAAKGVDLGDLFEYKLKDRVTIRKNESALVPIVQAHVKADKVSLWNSSLGSPRPLRALWLTNSSPLTLDGGSFSVLENETFAGEGLTDSIKPGEKRLLSYAADLGMRVDSKSESNPQRVTHVRIGYGVMVQISETRQETTYTVRDDDTTSRTVVIEHPLRTGWTLDANSPKPEETTSNLYRFRLNVGAKSTVKLDVRESKPVSTSWELNNITDNMIELFIRQGSINPEIEAALRKIVAQKNRVAALQAEATKRNKERKSIFDDQQRLRENMKALKGSSEERTLTQRYVQQLNDEETRLGTLEKESVDFQAQKDQAQQELNHMIESLALDATI
jgi:hypothetical protein